jgi:hypothetical protein
MRRKVSAYLEIGAEVDAWGPPLLAGFEVGIWVLLLEIGNVLGHVGLLFSASCHVLGVFRL